MAGAGRTIHVLWRRDLVHPFGTVCSASSGRSGGTCERAILSGLQVGDAAGHQQRAGQKGDKPIDLFKIKSKDKGKPEHEARLAAYGALVVTQQRAGLYSMPCAAAVLA